MGANAEEGWLQSDCTERPGPLCKNARRRSRFFADRGSRTPTTQGHLSPDLGGPHGCGRLWLGSLRTPVTGIRLRRWSNFAKMVMPKAAMHQHNILVPCEHYVGPDREVLAVDPKPESQPVQFAQRPLLQPRGVHRPLPTTRSSVLVCPLSTRGKGRPSSA